LLLPLLRRKKKKWKKEFQISEETVEKGVRLLRVVPRVQSRVFPVAKACRALGVAAGLQSWGAFEEG
jgi:hypothetical protein